MTTIEIEFKTITPLGMTEATARRSEFGHGGQEDELVKWVMKAIRSDNVICPMITFNYDNDSLYGVSTSRIICDYSETAIVKWDDKGNVTEHIHGVKIDARVVRKLYHENRQRLDEYEKRRDNAV